MLQLNFNIVTTEERATFVNDFFSQNPDYIPTKHELDTITNYILYGKDPYINKKGEYDPTLPQEKWTNMPARKEIEIATKHSTWKKKEPISLDETLESPTFNEADLLKEPIHTKIPKPVFERSLESDIPTIQELWEVIDYYSEKLKQNTLSPSEKYKYTHMLIELRRQQFTLRDIFKPMQHLSTSANNSRFIPTDIDLEIDWEGATSNYGCAPMGLYRKGDARFENPLLLSNELDYWGYNLNAKVILDFRNPVHIDYIVSYYLEIEAYTLKNIISSQKAILDTFTYYLNNTKLTKPQREIVLLKIQHTPNKEIAQYINNKYGKSYSMNYISTIYQKACASIAKTAEHIFNCYLERINPLSFKRCNVCGTMKLRCPEEFIRKTRNSDGYSATCKECEHKRQKNKR